MSELNSQTKELVAAALGLSPDEVSEHTALGTTPQWDSLAHMRLILSLEEVLGAPLSPDAIVSIASPQDVATLLSVGEP